MYKLLTLSLDDDTIRELKEQAASKHISSSALIRVLIWSNADGRENNETMQGTGSF